MAHRLGGLNRRGPQLTLRASLRAPTAKPAANPKRPYLPAGKGGSAKGDKTQ